MGKDPNNQGNILLKFNQGNPNNQGKEGQGRVLYQATGIPNRGQKSV